MSNPHAGEHYGDMARAECYICQLEIERDELRAEREVAGRVLALVLLSLRPDDRDGWAGFDVGGLPAMVDAVIAERNELKDRLSHEICVGQDVEGELHDARAERDRLRRIVKDVPGIVETAVRDLQWGRWPARGRELSNDPDTIRDAVTEALTALEVGGEGT